MTDSEEKIIRVVLYARHSTDRQATSTKDQIARLKSYCARQGYAIRDIFTDEAISGAALINRPGIRKLIETALEGEWERIVAEDLSRLSRDQGDVAHFFKKMRFLDIEIETIAEGVINELHIGLKGTMNALYLSDLADKTRRGMVAAVLAGSVPGGKTFGYDLVSKFNEKGEPIAGLRKINEKEAEIIKEIFHRYAEGWTLKKICLELNRLKITAPKGGQWVPTTLVGQLARKTGLLRQTLYKGVMTFNRMSYRKHPETGKRLSVLRPESEWLRIPMPELAMVEEELFDRVQAMLEERSSMQKRRGLAPVLTDSEKKGRREKRYEKARDARAARARQLLGKYNVLITSRRMWCLRHDVPIKAVANQIYNCPRVGCPNRNMKYKDMIKLVVDDLLKLDPEKFVEYYKTKKDIAALSERSIHDKEVRIKDLRDKGRRIYDLGGDRWPHGEGNRILNEIEQKISDKLREIAAAKKRIEEFNPSLSPEIMLGRFRSIVCRFEQDELDQVAATLLKPTIERIGFGAVTDGELGHWRRWATVAYDWHELMKLLTNSALFPDEKEYSPVPPATENPAR